MGLRYWNLKKIFIPFEENNLCLYQSLRFFASSGTLVFALRLIILSQHRSERSMLRHPITPSWPWFDQNMIKMYVIQKVFLKFHLLLFTYIEKRNERKPICHDWRLVAMVTTNFCRFRVRQPFALYGQFEAGRWTSVVLLCEYGCYGNHQLPNTRLIK